MVGSNAWVISGNLTESGKPLIANDPHLENQIPSLWLQAQISYNYTNPKTQKSSPWNVIGGTMPGMPFVVSGKTPYFAWTLTTLYADTSDLLTVTLNDK
jgi:penicillin amidase